MEKKMMLRKMVSEKLLELGNLSVLALSFGVIFIKIEHKWIIFVSGIVLAVVFYYVGIKIFRYGGK